MNDTAWHQLTAEEVFTHLHSFPQGITPQEAARRRATHGYNELPREKPARTVVVFLRQFMSPLILILIAAALVSAWLGEWVDVAVIGLAVALNTVIGFVQEYKANTALERLRLLVEPRAIVLRAGRREQIAAKSIVPGDVLVLGAGDRIAADVRLFETHTFETNEAPLTGESFPAAKEAQLMKGEGGIAERRCMGYAGTSVASGRALGVVVATGLATELGKIAHMVQVEPEPETPLQFQLKKLARFVSLLVLLLVVGIFVVGVFLGETFFEMFEMSVALAVAAIPEGLAVAITIVLAIGMQRVLKRHALTRRLIAAETLGSVTVICTDKTGTITKGEMQVVEVAADETYLREDLLRDVMLCNDASVTNAQVFGTPTDRALMEAGLRMGIHYYDLYDKHGRLDEIPFTSDRKFMATLHHDGKKRLLVVKGAPERLLPFCKQSGDDVHKKIDAFTRQGIRMIGVAHKTLSGARDTLEETDLQGMTFLGVIGLQDPLRPRVAVQVQEAKDAGIRTIMVTGDHPNTAAAIAKEAGILRPKGEIATGPDLDTWDDAMLMKKVKRVDVFARVEPRHKIRIVKALQAHGEVVGMTGDGVNDAPALKAADIGIAVGSGTEVAKEASDLVILDDNFATITAAIEEGRVIFDNIRKSTVYLLAGSFTELVLIVGALLAGFPLPLLPVQILWINLVTDSLPNIGLTLERGEPDVMRLPPRPRGEPVLNRDMKFLVFVIGLVTDAVLFVVFAWMLKGGADAALARTLMFAAVGFNTLIYIFALRSFRRSIFELNPFANRWLVGGVAVGFILMFTALLTPFLRDVFELVPIHWSYWILLIVLACIKLVFIEAAKEIFLLRGWGQGRLPTRSSNGAKEGYS